MKKASKKVTLESLAHTVEKLSANMTTLAGNMTKGFKQLEKNIVRQVDEKIEELAIATAKGFAETASKQELKEVTDQLDKVDHRLTNVEDRLIVVEGRLSGVEHKLTDHWDKSSEKHQELKYHNKVLAKGIKAVALKTGVAVDLAVVEK